MWSRGVAAAAGAAATATAVVAATAAVTVTADADARHQPEGHGGRHLIVNTVHREGAKGRAAEITSMHHRRQRAWGVEW